MLSCNICFVPWASKEGPANQWSMVIADGRKRTRVGTDSTGRRHLYQIYEECNKFHDSQFQDVEHESVPQRSVFLKGEYVEEDEKDVSISASSSGFSPKDDLSFHHATESSESEHELNLDNPPNASLSEICYCY